MTMTPGAVLQPSRNKKYEETLRLQQQPVIGRDLTQIKVLKDCVFPIIMFTQLNAG